MSDSVYIVQCTTDLERSRIRYSNGQVRKDRQCFVSVDAFEGKVVGNLMNGKEKVVIRSAANRIREKQEPKREWV